MFRGLQDGRQKKRGLELNGGMKNRSQENAKKFAGKREK